MVPVIEIVLVETEGQAIFVSKLQFFFGSVPSILVLSWETVFTTQFCHCNIFIYVTIGQLQILIYDDNIMMQSSFNIEQELFVIYILFGNSFPLLVVDSSINVLMHDRNDLSLLYCKFWLTWTWWMFTILLLLMLFLRLIFFVFHLARMVLLPRLRSPASKWKSGRTGPRRSVVSRRWAIYLLIIDTSDLQFPLQLYYCSTMSLVLTYTNVICAFYLLQTKAGDAKKK